MAALAAAAEESLASARDAEDDRLAAEAAARDALAAEEAAGRDAVAAEEAAERDEAALAELAELAEAALGDEEAVELESRALIFAALEEANEEESDRRERVAICDSEADERLVVVMSEVAAWAELQRGVTASHDNAMKSEEYRRNDEAHARAQLEKDERLGVCEEENVARYELEGDELIELGQLISAFEENRALCAEAQNQRLLQEAAAAMTLDGDLLDDLMDEEREERVFILTEERRLRRKEGLLREDDLVGGEFVPPSGSNNGGVAMSRSSSVASSQQHPSKVISRKPSELERWVSKQV